MAMNTGRKNATYITELIENIAVDSNVVQYLDVSV